MSSMEQAVRVRGVNKMAFGPNIASVRACVVYCGIVGISFEGKNKLDCNFSNIFILKMENKEHKKR